MSNVIVFMSDEHNPRYSSPYGHEFVDTPNMQWLADNGTLFEQAYCPSPLCVPSRSAFLTGKRVHAVKAYGNNRGNIPPETHGLGAVLGDGGVHSVFIGKVHAYRPVAELGFSETIETHDLAWGFDKATGRRPLAVRQGAERRLDNYGIHERPWKNDVVYMDAAVEWLRTRAREIDRPWVLYVNLVHRTFPISAPTSFGTSTATTATCRHTGSRPRPRNTPTRPTCAGTSPSSASRSTEFAGYAGATTPASVLSTGNSAGCGPRSRTRVSRTRQTSSTPPTTARCSASSACGGSATCSRTPPESR